MEEEVTLRWCDKIENRQTTSPGMKIILGQLNGTEAALPVKQNGKRVMVLGAYLLLEHQPDVIINTVFAKISGNSIESGQCCPDVKHAIYRDTAGICWRILLLSAVRYFVLRIDKTDRCWRPALLN
ncbi:hypothetical protein F4W66_24685 (plasmid) [Escherichia coli]|nr:hypothetical protein F4W66_24685 [Escherichia coli]